MVVMRVLMIAVVRVMLMFEVVVMIALVPEMVETVVTRW